MQRILVVVTVGFDVAMPGGIFAYALLFLYYFGLVASHFFFVFVQSGLSERLAVLGSVTSQQTTLNIYLHSYISCTFWNLLVCIPTCPAMR